MGDAIEAAGAGVRRVVGWEMVAVAVALVVLVRVVIKRISVGGSAMAKRLFKPDRPIETVAPEAVRERSYLRADPWWRAAMPETIDGQPPLPVSDMCPVTLDELLTQP